MKRTQESGKNKFIISSTCFLYISKTSTFKLRRPHKKKTKKIRKHSYPEYRKISAPPNEKKNLKS